MGKYRQLRKNRISEDTTSELKTLTEMSLWLANGISPTLSNARVDTGVVYASAMVRAFAVSLALAANARSQSVSSVSRWARANCKVELFLIAEEFKASNSPGRSR